MLAVPPPTHTRTRHHAGGAVGAAQVWHSGQEEGEQGAVLAAAAGGPGVGSGAAPHLPAAPIGFGAAARSRMPMPPDTACLPSLHQMYGAHFKDVDHTQKSKKMTFDSDDE